jgi:antirestriction protein ArdC
MNGQSGNLYKGMNVLASMCHQFMYGLGDPRYLTFNQIRQLGGFVKKGSKGNTIIHFEYIKKLETITMDDGTTKEVQHNYPKVTSWHVFGVEQCDKLEADKLQALTVRDDGKAEPERLTTNMPSVPTIKHGLGDRAYYRPSEDLVSLPDPNQFGTQEAYLQTMAHELGHSTGHPSRLNRKGITENDGFGNEVYSFEELTAELTSCFVCSTLGVMSDLEPHAGYIQSWLKVLKSDRKMIVKAASEAQKAADYILFGKVPEHVGEPKNPEPEPVTDVVGPFPGTFPYSRDVWLLFKGKKESQKVNLSAQDPDSWLKLVNLYVKKAAGVKGWVAA